MMHPLNLSVSDESALTPIQEFYAGENIFITGGTGFLGKLLLEKLLRSCPEIGSIYLLVRNKKGKGLHERVEALVEDVVFDRLKEMNPKFRHKIIAVEGDASLPELGINDQDRQLLLTEVSIVFHAAATVNFVEKLALAVPTNIRGTQYIIKLCKEMANLKVIVHVSTAYSNCLQDVIEEKFYLPPISPAKLIGLVEVLGDDVEETITMSLLGQYPNTYAYTKAVAENVVSENGRGLPVAIFRPAIVSSTYREPVEGWVNNFYGPMGVIAAGYAGVMRALHCDSTANSNMVPADMTINALVAIPWDVTTKYLDSKANRVYDIPIYNFESNSQQPLTWISCMDRAERYGLLIPTMHAIWYYSFAQIKHYSSYFISVLLIHYLPAVLGDILLTCMAKKPRLVKLYRKIQTFSSVIAYFSTRNFQFNSVRIREMISNMSPKDRELFFCDIKKLDWEEYMRSYMLGLRIYLLKDPMCTLPKALVKWRRLYWCHQAVKTLLFLIFFRLTWFVLAYGYKLLLWLL